MIRLKRLRVIALLALVCVTANACMTTMVGIAPSSTPITGNDTYTEVGPTTGRAYGYLLYAFPIGEMKPSGKARDRAINKVGADALIEVCEDVTVVYMLLLTVVITRVTGTGVKVRRGGEMVE